MGKFMYKNQPYGGASSYATAVKCIDKNGNISTVQAALDEQDKKFDESIRIAQFKASAQTVAKNSYAEYTLTLQNGSYLNSNNIKEYYPIGYRQLGVSGSNLAFITNYRYDWC